jgi:hypothetical protein
MKTYKEKMNDIMQEIRNGEKFESFVTMKPKSPCGIFVYLFCSEMDRLEEKEGLLTSLNLQDYERKLIRAYRWDLITVDMIFRVISRNAERGSMSGIKSKIAEKYSQRLNDLFPNCHHSELSLNDLVMACPREEIPSILAMFLQNFVGRKKLPSAA